MFYAFVPNYLELTRGTRSERRATRGLCNARGFHGNAILSRWPLGDVRRVPLPLEYDWFGHRERRIGTRVALRATLQGREASITFAVAHLEAFATPAQRARQIKPGWPGAVRLLGQRAVDAHRLTRSVVEYEPLFAEARMAGFTWQDLNPSDPTWRFHRFLPTACRVKLDWVFGRDVKAKAGSNAIVPPRTARGISASHPLSDHDGLSLCVWL
jgi:endonuclease/exonuclease/phosphatase family metal-dependent hydrolase